MADKFINETGLQAIKTWADGKYATNTALQTLDDRVDDIIAEGGEPNVIETIKIDGTALTPDANKAVNVPLSDYLTPYAGFESNTDYIGLVNNDYSVSFTKNADDTVTLESSAMSPQPSPLATTDYVDAVSGDPNVIEAIETASGTRVPVTNKTAELPDYASVVSTPSGVNISNSTNNYDVALRSSVPTATSDLTNDGDGSSNFATESYVSQHGGKIDVIQVNGTAQTITNKTVNIPVPTKVSDITNDSGFQTATDVATTLANSGDPYQTESDVNSAISTAVTSAYKYKGSVATYQDLPASGNTTGDVWDVQADGMNYAWTGTAWDALGAYVDTSVLWTSQTGQSNTLVAMTVAEINAILNA